VVVLVFLNYVPRRGNLFSEARCSLHFVSLIFVVDKAGRGVVVNKLAFSADSSAPVYTSESVEVDAPVDVVWNVMVSVDKWPRWNPDIRDASVDGPVAEGTTFHWKAGPSTIHSTFRCVDPPNVLGWTGKTMGIPAVHVYRLVSGNGSTRLILEESWSGVLPWLFRGRLQKALEQAVATGLQALKHEAERRAVAAS
jgi:hypothetical protein